MNPRPPSNTALAPAPGSLRGTGVPSRRRRVMWGVVMTVGWVLVAVGAVLAAAGAWVRRTFGVVSLDQLMMNMPVGGERGAGGSQIVVDGVFWGLIVPLLSVLALAACVEFVRRGLRKRTALQVAQVAQVRLAQGGPAPRRRLSGRAWMRGLATALAVAVPLAGAASLSSAIGVREYVDSYVREAVTGTTLGDFHVAPPLLNTASGSLANSADPVSSTDSAAPNSSPARVPGDEPRNLVVIYLESIEDSLADDTLFEINMLDPVQRATTGWESIDRLEQYEGGGWTMAGLVSTQCGVPLRSAGATADTTELNLMGATGASAETYLPGAVCLGDVLKDRGFRNVFLGGADAKFAGKGSFLTGHGYDEVRDLATWEAVGETETNPAWGLSDRRLFELAAETVTELHDAGEPFNLTLLSLDSHEFPHAYDYCEIDTEAPMAAITRCSMEQVAGFIDYLGQQGYLEDTAVIVMGDHEKFIAEANSFEEELSSLDSHTIFNRLWLPRGARLEIARDDTDQLSMFATMLEMAGIEVPDRRAGVGVSVFEAGTPVGSIRALDGEAYRDVVTSRSSEFYRELWGVTGSERVEAAATP